MDVPVIAAFGAGVLSFLSPCVLSMVPVYLASLLGDVAGPGVAHQRLALLRHSIAFVVGFSLVFVTLGAVAGLTGYAIKLSAEVLSKITGSLLIAFGLFMIAAIKVPWLNFERRLATPTGRSTGYLRSFLIGAAFSLGWTACVGPILASVLVLASARATAWQGAYLLSVYSLGLGLPFLVMGAAFDSLAPWLRRLLPYSAVMSVVSGLLLIAVGILVMTDNLLRLFSLAG